MPLIKFYANLRTVAGMKEMTVQGTSILAVLGTLAQDFPDLQPFLLEKGQLHPRVIIILNGQTLDSETSLETPVSGQDRLDIFPPISGG
jgi:MoaD family protein